MANISLTTDSISELNLFLYTINTNSTYNKIPILMTFTNTAFDNSDVISFSSDFNDAVYSFAITTTSDDNYKEAFYTCAASYKTSSGTFVYSASTDVKNDYISFVRSNYSIYVQGTYNGVSNDLTGNYAPSGGGSDYGNLSFALALIIANDGKHARYYGSYNYRGYNESQSIPPMPDLTAMTSAYSSAPYTSNNYSLNRGLQNTDFYTNIANVLNNGAKLYDPDDPFNGSDDSAPNGGGGNMDYTSDEDDFPALPTNTVADSGFVTLYAPTAAQLKSLADYLWSDTFSLDSFKKLFNNPMDCILGLSLVPVNLPHGTAKEITVGNLVSTVSCDTCTTQYVYVDCGSITVSPTSFTNSYLDFSPYTQMSIYLPYIGTEPLDVDECMDATIHVRYHIDVLTGAMCCFVKITNTNPISGSSATHVLYTYMGQCCESVPLSSDQWGNTIGAIMQAAAAIGGVVATASTGGAAAPAAAAQLTMATTATVNAATSMKPTVNHSGSLGGGGGMMAQRTPKLIMKAPNISKPASQQSYTGYPVNQTKKLSACSGFTQVQNINLSVSGATQSELNEIENLLVTGVII